SFGTSPLIFGRVLPDGSDDPNFKRLFRSDPQGGVMPGPVTVSGLVLQPDGKVLLASSLGLQRFLAHGGIDTSFAVTNLLPVIRAVELLHDGKLLVAGS